LSAATDTGLCFLPLGTGDFFSRRNYHSSIVALAGGRALLVDCPSPLRKMLYEASSAAGLSLDAGDLEGVILTHLHGDHANGLEELAYYNRFLRSRRPRLWSGGGVLADLWEKRLRASLDQLTDENFANPRPQRLEDWFDVEELRPGAVARSAGGLRIETHPTRHFLPCYGTRLRWEDCSLGYSSDTVFLPELIEFLAPCDVIIHECGEAEGHTFLKDLLGLPEALRAKMFLTHLPDSFDVAASPIPALEAGRLYSVRELKAWQI